MLWEYGGIYTDLDDAPGPQFLNGSLIQPIRTGRVRIPFPIFLCSITTASCNVSCSPAYYSTLDRIEKYLRTECTIRYWACGYQMCIKRTFVKGRGAADAKMGMVHYAKKKPRDGQKTKPHSCYHENYQHLQSL